MKSLPLIAIILLLAAMAGGCRRGRDARLVQLDSALWRNPDSVFKAAGAIDSASLSRRDRAFLRLLRTEAADKSYQTDTSAATISALKDYYLNGDREKDLHPRVNYILGRISVEKGRMPTAVECFRKALRSADEKKTDPKLMMVINSQLAQIFSNSNLFRHALKYTKDVVRYAEETDDPMLFARTNLNLASEYRDLNYPDSAMEIYRKVCPIFEEIDDPVQTTIFASQLASFYKDIGDLEKADSVIKGTDIVVDAHSMSSVKSIMSRIDARFGRTESLEETYLDLLANSDNIYARRLPPGISPASILTGGMLSTDSNMP